MHSISVVQIINSEKDVGEVVKNNAEFLALINIEYIVLDYSKNLTLLGKIKSIKIVKYLRYEPEPMYKSVIKSANIADGKKIIFLQENDVLNNLNVEQIENNRLNFSREQIKEIQNIKFEKYTLEDLHTYFKKNKSFSEKVRLFLK